jgi:hypothetical protein
MSNDIRSPLQTLKPSQTQGQALLEFVGTLLVWLLGITWSLHSLSQIWNRSYCAYVTFEATSTRLHGRPSGVGTVWEREGKLMFEMKDGILRGTAICGPFRETVELPLLKAARWIE